MRGGDELEPTFILGAALLMITILCVAQSYVIHSLRRTIEAQQATIFKLVSNTPVTYQETGQTPQKPSKEIYAAWGSQMVDLDKDT